MLPHLVGLILLALAGAGPTHAQANDSYPSKPIRLVLPAPAGGPTDALARQFAKSMAEILKQPLVVDNRPGASTTIGAAEVAKAPADGYTLLFTLADTFTYVPHVFKKLPYNPQADFALISQIAATAPVLVSRPELGTTPLRQLVMPTRDQPVNFATWGSGTYPHLIAASIAERTGSTMTIVPYKGGAPALQDFMGGVVNLAVVAPSMAKDLQAKGMARIVAVAGATRLRELPDVPTYAEQGFADPIFTMTTWAGFAAPTKTPPAILKKLNEAARSALQSPEMQKYLESASWVAMGTTPADFRSAVERELPALARVMRLAGVQPE